jgi:hypothetical protein
LAFQPEIVPFSAEKINSAGPDVPPARSITVLASCLLGQNVAFDRILNANKEPQNWLTYSGALNGQRQSGSQITPVNVKNLELQ